MKRAFALTAALLMVGCGPKQHPEDTGGVDDALISFNVNAQATRWSEALEYITEDEQVDMLDGSGNLKPEYKQAMSRLKLSALQKYNFELDARGRLIGMLKALQDANRRFNISDEQRKVGYDPNVPTQKPKTLQEKQEADAKAREAALTEPTIPEPTKVEPSKPEPSTEPASEPAPVAVPKPEPKPDPVVAPKTEVAPTDELEGEDLDSEDSEEEEEL